jgi:hypothetical protein
MTQNIFIFIIASFNIPQYLEFIKMRKIQLKKYNIPHCFLFDDLPPENYVFDENDLYIPKQIIENNTASHSHMNPYMILRFLKGIQDFDTSNYDYILRVNISTYLNIPKLFEFLKDKEKEKTCMAHLIYQKLPEWDIYNTTELTLFSGTCIIMTKDVIEYLKRIAYNDPVLSKLNDDTVLSNLINKYVKHTHSVPTIFFEHEDKICVNIFYDNVKDYCLARIKNEYDRNIDVFCWKYLLKLNDNIII